MSFPSPQNGQQAQFPRPLTDFEREALLWLLPAERPGYNAYRRYVAEWKVLGDGRRGPGNYILGAPNHLPDIESPLPQVFAYGVIEAEGVRIAVTLRELFEKQLEYEIVNLSGDSVPEQFAEKRRWSFSSWSPASGCPSCGTAPREIRMERESGGEAVLAICVPDRKLWIFDIRDGVSHLIPVTNFHNALMIEKNIRDPKQALVADNLFRDLRSFSDADLTSAFVRYNKLRKKIDLGTVIPRRASKLSLVTRLFSILKK